MQTALQTAIKRHLQGGFVLSDYPSISVDCMYCRFGNSEFFCGGADGRVMLDDILAEDNGSVFRIRFWCKLHFSHSNANLWLCYLYAWSWGK